MLVLRACRGSSALVAELRRECRSIPAATSGCQKRALLPGLITVMMRVKAEVPNVWYALSQDSTFFCTRRLQGICNPMTLDPTWRVPQRFLLRRRSSFLNPTFLTPKENTLCTKNASSLSTCC